MSKFLRVVARGVAALCVLGLMAGVAQAQAAKKPVAKTSKTRVVAKAAPTAAVAAPAAIASLSPEQLSIAQIVQTGTIPCELGQSVTVTADPKIQGAFDVKIGKNSYDTIPIPSKTGAIRLEDAKRGIVYMQLANKSMLLDERNGRRLADECVSPQQQAVAVQLKAQAGPGILDTPAK